MLRVRSFRPFPVAEVAAALKGKTAVAGLDRAVSPGGAAHPLFQDTRSALHSEGVSLKMINYLYGIGGRDANVADFRDVFADLERMADSDHPPPSVRFVGLRE